MTFFLSNLPSRCTTTCLAVVASQSSCICNHQVKCNNNKKQLQTISSSWWKGVFFFGFDDVTIWIKSKCDWTPWNKLLRYMQVSEPFILIKSTDSFLILSEVGHISEVLKSQYCKPPSLTLGQTLKTHFLIARLFHSFLN